MAPNKSEVWKYFSKVDKTSFVKCLLCGKNLKFSNNTTNMLQHLRLKHQKEADDLLKKSKSKEDFINLVDEEHSIQSINNRASSNNNNEASSNNNNEASSNNNNKGSSSHIFSSNNNENEPNCSSNNRQPLILNSFNQIKSFATGGSKKEKLTNDIVGMIVKDNLPFDFVEGKGFLDFMKNNFPLFKVPSRNTIKARIDSLYATEKEKCVEIFRKSSCLCITTDAWTDTAMKSMLGITVHGVYKNEQTNIAIGVFPLTEAHTAQHISEVLIAALNDFSIDEKQIIAVVTDNAANVVKAINDTFGKKRHIPCFAHTLNLVCENSLNITEITAIVSKCREIVKWFKRSVKASDQLREVQSNAGVSEGKMLKCILDVKTRWNSTYYMLERFIKIVSYISSILFEFYDSPPMISPQDKSAILEIISILRPLEAMTVQISGEKYASLSQVIPLVHCGREQLVKTIISHPAAIKLKSMILSEFDRRFGSTEHMFLLAASTLLDPRFKKIHFSDPLALAAVMRHLRTEMQGIEDSIESGSETSLGSIEEDFDLWATHKSLIHKRRKRNDDMPQDELAFFLNAQNLELKRNVIDAWEEMKSVYPKLYTLSNKYCHLMGTSVPAERLFSKAGATATLKRNRLTTKRLGKLLFLQSWLNK